MTRRIVASAGEVSLAEPLDGDRQWLSERDDGAYNVDPDDRTPLHAGPPVHRLVVVDAAGELLGQVNWHAVGHGPTAGCTAWGVGIGLLPASRGRGVGVFAMRLLVEHLFATTEVDRIEASTDRENLPAQRLLDKAGFHAEGMMRGAQLRGGERRDMLAYSLLRTDLAPTAPSRDEDRVAVAARDGVVLVELCPGDKQWLDEQGDAAFEVDPDPRPRRLVPQVRRLGVLDQVTGKLIGSVGWHPVGYGNTAACEAWHVGIALLPATRGRGVGATALRLLAEHLFATTEVDRVEAGTDRENLPAQRALTNAGFRTEGLLRGAQLRDGRRRDMLSYSILRSDLVEAASGGDRVVARRAGVLLAEPAPGDQEKFYVAGSGEFAVDQDERPRVAGPSRSSLLSVLDAVTGELLGGVSWHAVDYGGTVGCSAWNIGIGLLPEHRGRGVGTLAQRLLAEHLFATTDLDRIEASTDVDNIAEQRALERAGFRREGVLRGAQVRGGQRRDLVHFGVLRGDF